MTHVIANTDERGACARTLKVLMAILAGKWVLNVNCEYIFSEEGNLSVVNCLQQPFSFVC